jgi:hypothetical protein
VAEASHADRCCLGDVALHGMGVDGVVGGVDLDVGTMVSPQGRAPLAVLIFAPQDRTIVLDLSDRMM